MNVGRDFGLMWKKLILILLMLSVIIGSFLMILLGSSELWLVKLMLGWMLWVVIVFL